MTLEEYAQDVNKTMEEVMALCETLGIHEDVLSDEAITLLDNEIQNESRIDTNDLEDEEDLLLEKVEKIVQDANIDIDRPIMKKEKVKRDRKSVV